MKLSELSPEQKTRLLAELDGWTKFTAMVPTYRLIERDYFPAAMDLFERGEQRIREDKLPNYATSYDAIIPLIQKLDDCAKVRVEDFLESIMQTCYWFDVTPSQLCNAVLVATGKAEL